MSAVRNNYLEHKVAVVTGGCSGIGNAICERFMREGAIVYAADVSDSAPEGALFQKHDVTSNDSAKALMDRVAQEQGELATSNAQQVAKIRGIIESLGYDIATPDQARERLGLKGSDNVNF